MAWDRGGIPSTGYQQVTMQPGAGSGSGNGPSAPWDPDAAGDKGLHRPHQTNAPPRNASQPSARPAFLLRPDNDIQIAEPTISVERVWTQVRSRAPQRIDVWRLVPWHLQRGEKCCGTEAFPINSTLGACNDFGLQGAGRSATNKPSHASARRCSICLFRTAEMDVQVRDVPEHVGHCKNIDS